MSVIYSPPQFTFLRMQLSLYCSMHVMRIYPFGAGSQHAPYTIFGQAYPRGRLVCCLHSHFLCAHLPSKRNLRINGNFLLYLIWKKNQTQGQKTKKQIVHRPVYLALCHRTNGITFNFKNNWPIPLQFRVPDSSPDTRFPNVPMKERRDAASWNHLWASCRLRPWLSHYWLFLPNRLVATGIPIWS